MLSQNIYSDEPNIHNGGPMPYITTTDNERQFFSGILYFS